MEEIMKELRKIQNEITEQKTTILQSAETVTEKVTKNINDMLEEKFKGLEEKYENLKEKIENQEKRLYYLEKNERQRNVVFFGLEEIETSYSNLENILIEFVNKFLSIELERRDIQEMKRLGKKGERPRPLTVTFSTLGTKIDILKQKKALNGTTYYLKEDFPHYVIEKRKELQELVNSNSNSNSKFFISNRPMKALSKRQS